MKEERARKCKDEWMERGGSTLAVEWMKSPSLDIPLALRSSAVDMTVGGSPQPATADGRSIHLIIYRPQTCAFLLSLWHYQPRGARSRSQLPAPPMRRAQLYRSLRSLDYANITAATCSAASRASPRAQ